MGLSPRVRGSLPKSLLNSKHLRSIPTCTGQPPQPSCRACACSVYPHVCGADACVEMHLMYWMGLSPRVRGRISGLGLDVARLGSIPTCAGQTLMAVTLVPVTMVYPHVCGADDTLPVSTTSIGGLSPRVRGRPRRQAYAHQRRGSIPACAGQTLSLLLIIHLHAVYPRVCGADRFQSGNDGTCMGLSPRVRGSPCASASAASERRSIPACVGQTGWLRQGLR